MNQNMKKRLSQFVLPALFGATVGLGCSTVGLYKKYFSTEVELDKEYYTIKYQDDKLGRVSFTKECYPGSSHTYVLKIDDDKGTILTDFECDGSVNVIKEINGYYTDSDIELIDLSIRLMDKGFMTESEIRTRSILEQKKAGLEQKFAKANEIFAQFTTTGELADLIKKAEAEWREKYKVPENDPLDKYLN